MSIKSTLMHFVNEGRIKSFDAHSDKKATLHLRNGNQILIYMPTQYIIGGAEIEEAIEQPRASCLVYNAWDIMSRSTQDYGKRLGVDIYNFGAFGHYLDQINAN